MIEQLKTCKEIAKKIRVLMKKQGICGGCKDAEKCSQELRVSLVTTRMAFSDQVKTVLKQVQEAADGNPVGSEKKKVV